MNSKPTIFKTILFNFACIVYNIVLNLIILFKINNIVSNIVKIINSKQYCNIWIQYWENIVNFFFDQTILFYYCCHCLCYCGYCLQYCFGKNNIVYIVYYIVGVCALVQYSFVLFIHHWYLLSRFLLFFIGIIVNWLCSLWLYNKLNNSDNKCNNRGRVKIFPKNNWH